MPSGHLHPFIDASGPIASVPRLDRGLSGLGTRCIRSLSFHRSQTTFPSFATADLGSLRASRSIGVTGSANCEIGNDGVLVSEHWSGPSGIEARSRPSSGRLLALLVTFRDRIARDTMRRVSPKLQDLELEHYRILDTHRRGSSVGRFALWWLLADPSNLFHRYRPHALSRWRAVSSFELASLNDGHGLLCVGNLQVHYRSVLLSTKLIKPALTSILSIPLDFKYSEWNRMRLGVNFLSESQLLWAETKYDGERAPRSTSRLIGRWEP